MSGASATLVGAWAPRWLRHPHTPALGVVLAILVGVELLPHRMSFGIYLTGVVFGVWTGLVALAVVLVFRSNRLINFAAFQTGGTAAVLFAETLQHHLLARLLTGDWHRSQGFPSWSLTFEYWTAAVLALGLAMVLSAATYLLVVRRLRTASTLVGTVATIAVAVLLAQGTALVVSKAFSDARLTADTQPPQNLTWTVDGTTFHLAQILTLVIGMLAVPLVALLLRRSRIGTGVRAASDNADRAASLGVDGPRVVTAVWLVAGLLSGLAALLTVAATGPNLVGGNVAFVQVLAAVVLAGTVSRWLAFVAAVATGVLQQGLLWSFGRGDLADAALLALVVVVLLVRRRRSTERFDESDSSWQAAREVRRIPAELRGQPDVRRLRRRATVAIALLVVIFPFAVPTGDVATGTFVLIEAIVGLSLLMLTGWAGLLSLGQFALAAVGGYVAAVLAGHGFPAVAALLLAAAAGGLAALALGLPALRIRGLYLAIVTLAFAVATTTVLLGPGYAGKALPRSIGRPTLFGISTADERTFYFLTLLVSAACVAAVTGLRRSRTARALIATRDNERAAALFGISLMRARLQVFTISGVMAGLAGGLFAYQQGSVDVGNFGADASLLVFLVVILGGLGSTAGPILGAAGLGVLQLLPQDGLPALGLPIAVIVVLLAAQGGLTQGVFAARDALLRRIAVRNRIAVPSLVDRHHRGWSPDRKAPIAPKTGPGGAPAYVPAVYALDHEPLQVPQVAATGKGA